MMPFTRSARLRILRQATVDRNRVSRRRSLGAFDDRLARIQAIRGARRDWGSTVTEQLARNHSDAVVAIHLTDVPFGHLFHKPGDPSAAEKKFFAHNEQWMQKGGSL